MTQNNKETSMIYTKIIEVMELIGAVEKTKECNAPGARFKYRGIDAVMNALQPALIKAGVFPSPEVLSVDRQERVSAKGTALTFTTVRVKYRWYATDGSFVETTVAGEGMDAGDKSVNKAMSAAYKYAAFQVFCIPTEEMRDPDAQAYTDVVPQGYQSPAPAYAPQAPAPAYAPYPAQGQGYAPEGYPSAPPAAPQPQGYMQPEAPAPAPTQAPAQAVPAQSFASLNDAYNHVCTFGRNTGRSMGSIAAQPRSQEELGWYLTARPDSLEAEAARMILQSRVM